MYHSFNSNDFMNPEAQQYDHVFSSFLNKLTEPQMTEAEKNEMRLDHVRGDVESNYFTESLTNTCASRHNYEY